MKAQELLRQFAGEKARQLFTELYGEDEVDRAVNRYTTLLQQSIQAFPEIASGDVHVFTAAGRTELGGNHTDHNQGQVLAASIQLDAVAFVVPRDDTRVIFRSTGYPDVLVDIADTTMHPEEQGTTEALLRGIAEEFKRRGLNLRGFTANAASTVLSGSGLSSSAAVEVLFGTIFNGLYGSGRFGPVEIAQIGQRAENLYFGKPCGLMDQVACAHGGAVAIDFKDPANPVVRGINFNPADMGYTLCVVNTGGSHADLTADYAAVPQEMKAVAQFFGKSVLRELDRALFLEHLPKLRQIVGDRAILRALHFFDENDRVQEMYSTLERMADMADPTEKQQVFHRYLELVRESGTSSWELLQNISTPHHPEEQGIALALGLTQEFFKTHNLRGACRVHGGGFAGTIQAYVPTNAQEAYIRWMERYFGEGAVRPLFIRSRGAVELFF